MCLRLLFTLLYFCKIVSSNEQCLAHVSTFLKGDTMYLNTGDAFIKRQGVVMYDPNGLSQFGNKTFRNYVINYSDMKELEKTIHIIMDLNPFYCKSTYILIAGSETIAKPALGFLWQKLIYKTVVIFHDRVYTIDFERFTCVKIVTKDMECYDFRPYFIMKGCTVRIAWNKLLPFSINPNIEYPPGYIISIVDVIAYHYNLSLHFNDPSDKYLSDLYTNRTSMTLENEYLNNVSDIYLGALVPIEMKYNFLTNIIVQDHSNMLIPRQMELRQWNIFLTLLNWKYWLLVLGIATASTVIIYQPSRNKKGADLGYICLYLLALHLLYAPAMKRIERLLFVIPLFFYVIVFNVYLQGQLFSISTVPVYEKPIRTVKDAMESRYQIRMQDLCLKQILEPSFTKNDYISSTESMNEDVKQFFANEDFITAGIQSLEDIHKKHKKNYQKITLGSPFCAISTKPCFHLLEQFDRSINLLHAAGLIEKYRQDVLTYIKLNSSFENLEEAPTRSVGLEQLESTFWIFYIGVTLSIISFTIELIFYYINNKYQLTK